jgi:hypothetical protein
MKCRKCKCPVPDKTEHKCERCEVRLCRACDDRSDVLNWVEIGDKDEYLCHKCRAKLKEPETAADPKGGVLGTS